MENRNSCKISCTNTTKVNCMKTTKIASKRQPVNIKWPAPQWNKRQQINNNRKELQCTIWMSSLSLTSTKLGVHRCYRGRIAARRVQITEFGPFNAKREAYEWPTHASLKPVAILRCAREDGIHSANSTQSHKFSLLTTLWMGDTGVTFFPATDRENPKSTQNCNFMHKMKKGWFYP